MSNIDRFGSRIALVLLLGLPACAGTPLGRLNAAERTPSDGSAGGPSPDTLKVQMIKPGEFSEAPKKKLAPACDARDGAGKANAEQMTAAKKVVDAYAEFRKAKPKPAPKSGATVGDVVGMKKDFTRDIATLSFTCADKSELEVNGTTHAFDLAWALTGPAENEVSIQAVSLKDKKVVFAYVRLPSEKERANPKADSLEVITITNVASYLPADPDEPLVRNTRGKTNTPQYETLVFGKGAQEGFYWLVPLTGDLTSDRYLGVGRFKVGEPQ